MREHEDNDDVFLFAYRKTSFINMEDGHSFFKRKGRVGVQEVFT